VDRLKLIYVIMMIGSLHRSFIFLVIIFFLLPSLSFRSLPSLCFLCMGIAKCLDV